MKLIKYFIDGLIFIIHIPLYLIFFLWNGIKILFTTLPKYIYIGLKYITEKKDTNNPNQNILGNKFLPYITITLSIITYLLCIFIATRWYVQTQRNKKFIGTLNQDILAIQHDNIKKDTPDQYEGLTKSVEQDTNTDSNYINTNFINVNLDYYISKNSEAVGWIQVNNTNVNYPIVQHTDNEYYLNHDFYKRKTDIGWIFADYRDNFDTLNNNTIIYGHNLINRTMFGQIPYLLKKSWFKSKNSHYIKISTKKTNSIWQIFSVYKTPPTTDYLQSKFNSIEAYETFLNNIKNKSQQKFNIDLDFTDKIITLSTCDDIGTSRVVVHAKLIKIEDK